MAAISPIRPAVAPRLPVKAPPVKPASMKGIARTAVVSAGTVAGVAGGWFVGQMAARALMGVGFFGTVLGLLASPLAKMGGAIGGALLGNKLAHKVVD